MPSHSCPNCGTPLTGEVCHKCLLQTGCGTGESKAERLFQAALAHEESERDAFLEEAASDNPNLLEDARMLLQGYLESGGDSAAPTLGHAPHSRAAWAIGDQEEPGTMIGSFRLIRLLGEGGMGSVWEAVQTETVERTVALKVIKLGMDTREVVTRFEQERRTLALLNHDNIAKVFEAGATSLGRPYFAMELAEGVSITEHCSQEKLSLKDRISLFISVCSALEHAHQKGIIHRDIKPSNILVTDGQIKVIDFGIAKATREENPTSVTKVTQIVGTPAYMSPEQADLANADIDTRSDIYSLGVVLYELLTQTQPFDPERLAKTSVATMQEILLTEEPPRPSARREELKGELDWIVMQALSKERDRRYRSAAALADDLQRHLDGEVVQAAPPSWSYRAQKFLRKHKAAVATAAVLALTITTALVVSLIQTRKANEARREATLTIADLYTNNGLNAAELGKHEIAALWFTKAALTSKEDSVRTAAWQQEIRPCIAAFDTGEEYVGGLQWHPKKSALIVSIENLYYDQIWTLHPEPKRWDPGLGKILTSQFSPDGTEIVLTIGNSSHLLKFPSGEKITKAPTWVLKPVPARGIWASPDARFSAETGGDIIDQKNQVALILNPGNHGWQGMAFNSDSTLVATSSYDNHLRLWALPSGHSLGTIGDPHSTILRLAFAPGSSELASSEEGIVRIWETKTPKFLQHIPSENGQPSLVTVSSDGKLLARSGFTRHEYQNTSTQVFEITGQASGSLIGCQGTLMDALFIEEQLLLAVSTTPNRDGFNFEKGGSTGHLRLPGGKKITLPSEPRVLVRHPAEKITAILCAGGEVLEFSTTLKPLFKVPEFQSLPKNAIYNGFLKYNPDGSLLVVCGGHNQRAIWNRKESRHLIQDTKIVGDIFDLDFNSTHIATALVRLPHAVELYDFQGKFTSSIPYQNWPMVSRFDPSGKNILIGGGDNLAKVFHVESGQPLGPGHRHQAGILAGVFYRDIVITGGYDGQLHFWNSKTARSFRPPINLHGAICQILVSGDHLIASGYLPDGPAIIDLKKALPTSSEEPNLLRAEINANATIGKNGGLHRLSRKEWFTKWQKRTP